MTTTTTATTTSSAHPADDLGTGNKRKRVENSLPPNVSTKNVCARAATLQEISSNELPPDGSTGSAARARAVTGRGGNVDAVDQSGSVVVKRCSAYSYNGKDWKTIATTTTMPTAMTAARNIATTAATTAATNATTTAVTMVRTTATTVSTASMKTGVWTAEEHRLFLQGHEQYGKDWIKIATIVKSRTNKQIRTHGETYFQKLAKDDPTAYAAAMTAEEEKKRKRAEAKKKRAEEKKKLVEEDKKWVEAKKKRAEKLVEEKKRKRAEAKKKLVEEKKKRAEEDKKW
ncbi:hypothetical protein ACHAXR_000687, partial [Thalassiosira sp. AJA248-18]